MPTITGRNHLMWLLSMAVAALGAVVIAGWYLYIPLLLQIHPSFVPMQFNTALGFLLSGLAALALLWSRPKLARAASVGVMLIGGLTLWQIVTGYNLHIDQLFMEHYVMVKTATPGRMAPNTALCFLLTGAALWVRCAGFPVTVIAWSSNLLAPAILALAGIALSGYLLNFETAYGWGNLTRMAVHTAVGFCVLGLVVLLMREAGQVFNALPGVGIALLVFVLTLWQALQTEQVKNQQAQAIRRAEQIQSNWQRKATESNKALQRMAARFDGPGAEPSSWRKDAANYVQNYGYLALVRRDANGAIALVGAAQVAQEVLAQVSKNRCQTAVLWQTVPHPVDASDRLLIQHVGLGTGGQGHSCIMAVSSLRSVIEAVRSEVRSERYPWTLRLQGQPLYQEDSDGVWSTQVGLFPEQAGLTLTLTPTKAQRAGGNQSEWVLLAGLLLDSLVILALYWMQVAQRRAVEVQQAQRDISQQNGRFKMASAAAHLGFWDFDLIHNTLNWDEGMYQVYGHTPLEGLQPYALWAQSVHPDDLARSEQELNDAIKGDADFDTEFRIIRRDGALRNIRAIASVKHNGNGTATMMYGINFDVTDMRTAERRQSELIAKLTSINDELNSFTYIASHDLKSPLRGIDQLASWITEDLGDTLDATTAKHLRLMRSRINRMEMLLDDLLAYSRVGRSNDDIVSIDTRELVESVFEMQVANKPIRLAITDAMPVLNSQKVPLDLVFRNLIGNAIKHHDKPNGVIQITARRVDGFYEFSVQDDGPGIPPEHQQRVFAMFQTLKPRDEIEGSGIGLALVKKAVESVGGVITLESDGQHGCLFRFTWPMHLQKENTQ